MTEQKDLLSQPTNKKYERPKSQDNGHFSKLMDMGYSIPDLSREFCHDVTTIRKWVSGEQPAPLWTVTVANAIVHMSGTVASKYIISPTKKEDEMIMLNVMDRLKISYKKFDF